MKSVKVPPVVGQHRSSKAGGVGELVGIRNLLVRAPSLMGCEHIMTKNAQSIRQPALHVLVGEERGHACQSSSLSRMARSISSRCLS
jgi:hypothetical protein